MVLILLEALLALALLVLIVWWTMFSGRRNGELLDAPTEHLHPDAALPPTTSESDTTKNAAPRGIRRP